IGPLVIMIHMASVWVPFTSESKEAIADYDEIRKEMKLALMECGRKLGVYLKKRARMKRESERRDVFQKYIGEIARACNFMTGVDAKKIYDALLEQAKRKTAVADLELDDEGKRVKSEDPADQDGVIIVESPIADTKGTPFAQSKSEAAALKVAALANDEDEPSLIDVKPTKRAAAKEKPSKSVAKQEKSREAKKPASKPAVEKSAPAPVSNAKPRMRLVNGKMVPVDDGKGLFS
ncbi:MAG: hypothetical protein ACK5SZ_00815, partial [bacterium]